MDKKNEKTVQMPEMMVRAAFSPDTLDAEKRTVNVVVATETRDVIRWGCDGRFIEVLDCEESSIRLDRLNNGAPVVDAHNTYSIDAVKGVVERAWVEGGQLMATLQFSSRDDVKGVIQDIADGVLRNISVGYSVHRFQEDPSKDGEIPVMRAIDWEPKEISLVPVPADTAAGIRGKNDITENPCIFESAERTETKKEPKMKKDKVEDKVAVGARTDETPEGDSAEAVQAVDVNVVQNDATSTERARTVGITDACRKAGLDVEFSDNLIKEGTGLESARAQIIDRMADSQAGTETRGSVTVMDDAGRSEIRMGAAENWILHRLDPKNDAGADNQFRGESLYDMARMFAKEVAGTHNLPMGTKMEVARAAMHHTSDFPIILANVLGKRLRARYEQSPSTWEPLARVTSVSDFKQISVIQAGEMPQLEAVNESGEFKYGTFGESNETYVLGTYGKIVGLTRQMLINDDLRAFDRIVEGFADQAANLVSDLAWAQITSNPTMGDGTALFHADHANLGTGALSSADFSSLAALRSKVRLQKGLDGVTPLALRPVNLVVPVALETTAEQIAGQITPNAAGQVNPFRGVNVIVEPRLDEVSSTEFYISASTNQIDVIELAFLDGVRTPVIETEIGFDVDGMKIKCRLDVAAKVIDFRGLAKSTGV